MTVQLGSTKIGAMQYNGVTIGEARYNGQVVYRSIIRVTPQAPTFIEQAPWLILPTQAGVTYVVEGTPGAGNTVWVQATPNAGYELVGNTIWNHTYQTPHLLATFAPSVWHPYEVSTVANIGDMPNATAFGTSRALITEKATNKVGHFNSGHTRTPINSRPWADGGTIGCWFKDPGGATTGQKTIIQRASAPGATNVWELYALVDPGNGRLLVGCQVDGLWWDVIMNSGVNNIVNGAWHHVAVTLRKSGNNWTLTGYADGNPITSTKAKAVSGNFPDNFLYVGGGRDGSQSNMHVDDSFAIDRPLSAAELAQIRSYGRVAP